MAWAQPFFKAKLMKRKQIQERFKGPRALFVLGGRLRMGGLLESHEVGADPEAAGEGHAGLQRPARLGPGADLRLGSPTWLRAPRIETCEPLEVPQVLCQELAEALKRPLWYHEELQAGLRVSLDLLKHLLEGCGVLV